MVFCSTICLRLSFFFLLICWRLPLKKWDQDTKIFSDIIFMCSSLRPSAYLANWRSGNTCIFSAGCSPHETVFLENGLLYLSRGGFSAEETPLGYWCCQKAYSLILDLGASVPELDSTLKSMYLSSLWKLIFFDIYSSKLLSGCFLFLAYECYSKGKI